MLEIIKHGIVTTPKDGAIYLVEKLSENTGFFAETQGCNVTGRLRQCNKRDVMLQLCYKWGKTLAR